MLAMLTKVQMTNIRLRILGLGYECGRWNFFPFFFPSGSFPTPPTPAMINGSPLIKDPPWMSGQIILVILISFGLTYTG